MVIWNIIISKLYAAIVLFTLKFLLEMEEIKYTTLQINKVHLPDLRKSIFTFKMFFFPENKVTPIK